VGATCAIEMRSSPAELVAPYHSDMRFDRVTVDPRVMAGAPCIRGLRLPVATVVRMAAAGLSSAEIRAEFPELDEEDVRQALSYAAAVVSDHVVDLPA